MITLKTLESATSQEVFDQVCKHMLDQGKKSVRNIHRAAVDFGEQDGGSCAYRGKQGLKCAAGCLIADDEYSEKMELNGWHELVADGLVPEAHKELIRELQKIHDFELAHNWALELEGLAERLDLDYKHDSNN